MLFSQVVGQENFIDKVVSLVDSNHLPHAILLNGKDGYGNLILALATAQYISCINANKSKNIDCDCPSCRKYSKLIHPDLHFIFPNTTTDKIDKNNESSLFIDEFRKFVLENKGYCSLNKWYEFIGSGNKQGAINVRDANNIISSLTMKTYESEYKIMIIWNVDKMNQEASDKILKILEEPYPNTVFILTTQHKDNILPTIVSRVQQITVPPIDKESLYKAIHMYETSLTDEQIKINIALCEGDFNRYKELDSQNEEYKRQYFIELNRLAMMYHKKAKEISLFVDDFSKNTREELIAFFNYYLKIIEKCFLYNNEVKTEIHPLYNMDDKFKNNFPNFITSNNVEGIYKTVEQTIKNIEHNANAKINIFDTIIKLGRLLEKK